MGWRDLVYKGGQEIGLQPRRLISMPGHVVVNTMKLFPIKRTQRTDPVCSEESIRKTTD